MDILSFYLMKNLETIDEIPIYKLCDKDSGKNLLKEPDLSEDVKENLMTTDRKKYVIEGEAEYFTPFKADEYADGEYTITVGNLTKESQKLLNDLDIPFKDALEEYKDKPDRHSWNKFVKMRSQYPIKTLDGSKVAWPEDVAIGNGSKVRVVFYQHNWTYQKKSGFRGIPTTAQVVELVEYNPTNDADLLPDNGATPPAKGKAKAKVMDLDDSLDDILPSE